MDENKNYNNDVDYDDIDDWEYEEIPEMTCMDHIKARARRIRRWCSDHKAAVAVLGLTVLGMAARSKARKMDAVKAEEGYYYVDPTDQHTYDLKHEMSRDERDYFYIKRIQGEVTGQTTEDILREMNILK